MVVREDGLRIIVREDLLIGELLAGHAQSAPLAHADPVPPAFSGDIDIITLHRDLVIIAHQDIWPHQVPEILAFDDELLTVLLDDLQIPDAFAPVTVDDRDVLDSTHLIPMEVQGVLDIFETEISFPMKVW